MGHSSWAVGSFTMSMEVTVKKACWPEAGAGGQEGQAGAACVGEGGARAPAWGSPRRDSPGRCGKSCHPVSSAPVRPRACAAANSVETARERLEAQGGAPRILSHSCSP